MALVNEAHPFYQSDSTRSLNLLEEEDSVSCLNRRLKLEKVTRELQFIRAERRKFHVQHDQILIEYHLKLQLLHKKYQGIWQKHDRRTSLSQYIHLTRYSLSPNESEPENLSQQSHIPYVQNWEGQVCKALHAVDMMKKQRDLMNVHALRETTCMNRALAKAREELQNLRNGLRLRLSQDSYNRYIQRNKGRNSIPEANDFRKSLNLQRAWIGTFQNVFSTSVRSMPLFLESNDDE